MDEDEFAAKIRDDMVAWVKMHRLTCADPECIVNLRPLRGAARREHLGFHGRAGRV